MSDEMKLEVIKAAARGYEAKEIGEVLGLDIGAVKTVIDESTSKIEAEKAYREGAM